LSPLEQVIDQLDAQSATTRKVPPVLSESLQAHLGCRRVQIVTAVHEKPGFGTRLAARAAKCDIDAQCVFAGYEA
jgi:hypothetical protein